MDYNQLALLLRTKKMYIFTSDDLRNLYPVENLKTIKNNFTRWISKGYFVRLKKGLYELSERERGFKIPDLYIAHRLYSPSYVSIETALSILSVIPDIAAGVTSVTTMPTRTFKNSYGTFFYKSCKKEAFTGYRLVLYDGYKVYIADKEKALVDFLYYRLRAGDPLDFKEERLNKRVLRKFNWKKVFFFSRLFNQKTFRTAQQCKEYIISC